MPQFATEHAYSRLHLQAIPALAAASARALVAIACLLLAAGSASAQEQVQLDTQFSRGKLTELSGMKTTLAIPAFADERDVADPRTLFVGEQAEGGIALADRPFAEIVGEAMRAGFAASNARLESEGAGMRLSGTVTATAWSLSSSPCARAYSSWRARGSSGRLNSSGAAPCPSQRASPQLRRRR